MIQFLAIAFGSMFLVLVLNVLWDYRLIENLNRPVPHAFHATIFTGLFLTMFLAATGVRDLWLTVSFVSNYWSIRWIFHNLALNKLRGRDWDYLGNNTLDRLLKWINRFVPFMFVQIGVLMASVLFVLSECENYFGNGDAIGAVVFVIIGLTGFIFLLSRKS